MLGPGYLGPPPAAAAAALALPPLCPLNVRVGANSPSLCPTMSSVTYTLRKALPLWTRNVTPTKSGWIVQSRAHVLIGSRFPLAAPFSTLAATFGSIYGPFFRDRLIPRPPGFFPAISQTYRLTTTALRRPVGRAKIAPTFASLQSNSGPGVVRARL